MTVSQRNLQIGSMATKAVIDVSRMNGRKVRKGGVYVLRSKCLLWVATTRQICMLMSSHCRDMSSATLDVILIN